MAWKDERIAAQIVADSTRVIAAATAVGLEGDPAAERNDLIDAFADAVGQAADDPNAYGPAALELCRFCGRECEPLEQAAAFAGALEQAPLSAVQALPDLDYQVITATDSTLLYGLSLAIVRRDYAARQDAETVRADFLAAADIVMNNSSRFLDDIVFEWIFSFVGQASEWLAETITNRMPLVGVETQFSTPATVLGYRLYGDPERAGDLVARNGLLTALILPVGLQALADFSESVRRTGRG